MGPTQVERLAESIAREAHRGQKYGKLDYFEGHIIPAVTIARSLGYGPLTRSVVLLHDTPEDTPIGFSALRARGIPDELVVSVDAVTKRAGESHMDYLRRVAADGYATIAKVCDSSGNYAQTVLHSPYLTDAKRREWGTEYLDNIVFLRPFMPPPGGKY